jgi:hypothetical protein
MALNAPAGAARTEAPASKISMGPESVTTSGSALGSILQPKPDLSPRSSCLGR